MTETQICSPLKSTQMGTRLQSHTGMTRTRSKVFGAIVRRVKLKTALVTVPPTLGSGMAIVTTARIRTAESRSTSTAMSSIVMKATAAQATAPHPAPDPYCLLEHVWTGVAAAMTHCCCWPPALPAVGSYFPGGMINLP